LLEHRDARGRRRLCASDGDAAGGAFNFEFPPGRSKARSW
jgi:hypothetical protein